MSDALETIGRCLDCYRGYVSVNWGKLRRPCCLACGGLIVPLPVASPPSPSAPIGDKDAQGVR